MAELREAIKNGHKASIQQGLETEPGTYEEVVLSKIPEAPIYRFHQDARSQGNLEYLIAEDENDLSRGQPISFFITPEERAQQFLTLLLPVLFKDLDPGKPFARLFLKHTLQSLMGTHCVFGLRYMGYEIEEHNFVVHLDQDKRVVMLSCTYLPNLPSLLSLEQWSDEKLAAKVKEEVEKLPGFEQADGDRQWLVIWDETKQAYVLAPGNQVKFRLPLRANIRPTVLRVPGTDHPAEKAYYSAALPDPRIALGEINSEFLESADNDLSVLDDNHITKSEAVLQDLDSSAELIGRYASVKDEIDGFNVNKNWNFTGENGSYFDRVNAYYYLDQIQRYFREKLRLHLLDGYAQLNPARVVLSLTVSPVVAKYDMNDEKIVFHQLGPTGFTAARDARCVYHEFVHMITDAFARLHRGGQSLTPRAGQILQAQAMDEGMADYFACSLACQQGAKKPQYYFKSGQRWKVDRDLDPETARARTPRPVVISELTNLDAWNRKKYELGELWGRYLWQIRRLLGADVTDMLVAHSIFFLSRWATFEQGIEALQLVDRLLFSGKHRDMIAKPAEVIVQIQIL